MKFFILSSVVFAVFYVAQIDGIIGGRDAKIEDYPYQVALERKGGFWCGGAIISERHVLVTGLCLIFLEPDEVLEIRAGSDKLGQGGSLHSVERFLAHKNITPDYQSNAVLIRVKEPFQFDKTRQPIPLFGAGESVQPGVQANITGWGWTKEESYEFSEQLQTVTVPVLNKTICDQAYKSTLAGLVCAGVAGKGPCFLGDEGGPLVVGGRLAGLFSYSVGCARPDLPAAYTDIGYFRKWIDEHKEF